MTILFILVLAIILLGPIGGLLVHLNAAELIELAQSATFQRSLGVTVTSSGVGAFLSIVLALAFARPFALSEWRFKRLQRLGLLMPYLIPNFILAQAYVLAWNPTTGLLNRWIEFPGGLYGVNGLMVLFAIAHFPVAFLMIEEKIRRIDPAWREAARLSGASTWRIFRSIELPLLMPSVVGSFSLCFALNLSAFAIPAWIGAPAKAYPLTYKIYQAIQLGGVDGLSRAAAISVLLFALSIPTLMVGAWVQRGERKFAMVGGKASRRSNDSGKSGRFSKRLVFFQSFYWVSQALFWIAPVSVLIASTLVPPGCLQTSGVQCFSAISFSKYRYVIFELNETVLAIRNSLIYGSFSAIIILLLALGVMAMLGRSAKRLRLVEAVFSVPVATPGAIIALGLIAVASGRFGLNLYNTAWIVVAAYVIKHLNLAFQSIRIGVLSISPSLVEAARLSGARSFDVWRRILIPILRPEVLGAAFLVLIPILGELTMSVFLASPSFRSIGTVLFDLQDYADQASAGALSVVLIALVLALNQAARWLSKGKLGY